MSRFKTFEDSLGGVARHITDAQPRALADAMEALERERKLLSPRAEATRLAELGTASAMGEGISSLARLGDPLDKATAALGIKHNSIEDAARSLTATVEDATGLATFSRKKGLAELAGVVGIEHDIAETARSLSDPFGANSSTLDGELSLAKAAGMLGEVDRLRDAIGAVTSPLDALGEHNRMTDLLSATQPYHHADLSATATDALSPVSAPEVRTVPTSPAKGGGARKKVTSAKTIGELVREARRKMKLNQQEFADLAGVGRRFVSELEAGKSTLEFDKVLQACAAAGIDVTAASRSAS